jgi:tetratricopeptide (TPR) repeat protein
MMSKRSRFLFLACSVVFLLCASVPAQDNAEERQAKVDRLFQQGISYANQKKFDQAIEAYRELLKIEPKHPSALHNLGAALGNTRRHQEALEAFEAAVKLSPSQAQFHASLGGAYMSLRRWDESLAALNESVRLDPTNGATYNMLGFLYDNTRRYEEALAVNKKAIEYAPENPANFHNLGLTLIKLNRLAEAVEPLEFALRIAPDYKNARFHLSNVLSRLKRYKDAVESFTKLLELDADNADILTLRAWNYMYLGGSGLEAATDAERYLNLYGWRTRSSPFQAIIAVIGFRAAGMDERAAAIISDSHTKADQTLWPYKIILFFDGQLTSEELLKAASTTDQKTEAHTFIGMELQLRGEPDKAREHFEWVKEFGNPTFYEYPLALAELERLL